MNKDKEKERATRKIYYEKNKEYVLAQTKLWKKNNPEYRKRENQKELERRRQIRYKVLSHYSGDQPKCKQCGYSDIRALCIDHINEDGGIERRLVGNGDHYGCSSTQMYKWIVKNNFPPTYQVLCHNCNFVKGYENGNFGKHK